MRRKSTALQPNSRRRIFASMRLAAVKPSGCDVFHIYLLSVACGGADSVSAEGLLVKAGCARPVAAQRGDVARHRLAAGESWCSTARRTMRRVRIVRRSKSLTLHRFWRKIEREHLIVVPMGMSRHWYRYQQLFGELLRSALCRSQRELVADLHRRAASCSGARASSTRRCATWSPAMPASR